MLEATVVAVRLQKNALRDVLPRGPVSKDADAVRAHGVAVFLEERRDRRALVGGWWRGRRRGHGERRGARARYLDAVAIVHSCSSVPAPSREIQSRPCGAPPPAIPTSRIVSGWRGPRRRYLRARR